MTKTIILLIITYIFNLIDYWQTMCAVSHFGLEIELNPLVRLLFELGCAEIAKLTIPMILLVILGFLVKADKGNMWAVYTVTAFYFLLILHNFGVLMTMGLI